MSSEDGRQPPSSVEARLVLLQTEVEQLRTALSSRIVIEQAKGILIERLAETPEGAFELLRAAARRARRNLHDLAAEVVQTRTNPPDLEREIENRRRVTMRESRIRHQTKSH
jgi:hypothetical protein